MEKRATSDPAISGGKDAVKPAEKTARNNFADRVCFLLEIWYSFFRLGLVAFGGPAMVAYIRDLAVGEKKWLDDESFKDGVALCQTIPGATAMQAAAYAGLRAGGIAGALAAFSAFCLPAFFFMVILTILYVHTKNLPVAISAFKGLQVVVVALVANATWSFGKRSIKAMGDTVPLAIATFLLLIKYNPFIVIIIAAIVGMLIFRDKKNSASAGRTSGRSGVMKKVLPALILAGIVLLSLIGLYFLNRHLFSLSALMMKVDACAFGGGYASVPFMLHEVVDVKGWMGNKMFMDGIALGQVTPGPIVITATFVGYIIKGFTGALVASISVFTPSFIILIALVPFFDILRNNKIFQKALRGVLTSFVGLLLAVTIRFSLSTPWVPFSILLGLAAFIAFRAKVNIIWVVLIGSVIGAIFL